MKLKVNYFNQGGVIMSKRMSLIIVITLLISILTTGCLDSTVETPAADDSEKVEQPVTEYTEDVEHAMRFQGAFVPADFKENPAGIAVSNFLENVEKLSNGKIEVDLFTSGELASSADEYIGGLQNGSFEMISYSPSMWGNYTRAFTPINIPYMFLNEEVVFEFLKGPMGERMKAEALEDTGLRIVAFTPIGFRHVTNSKREIRSPEDMKGLKIRVMNDPLQIATMEAFGATAINLPLADVYSSLQQGLIDAQENPFSNFYNYNIQEVQEYLSTTGHQFTTSCVAINNEYYESLPKDMQEVIDEAGRICQEESGALSIERQKWYREKVEDVYLKVTDLTADELRVFQEAAKPVWDSVIKDIGQEAFDEIQEEIKRIEKNLGL